jgi:hypothetical protein
MPTCASLRSLTTTSPTHASGRDRHASATYFNATAALSSVALTGSTDWCASASGQGTCRTTTLFSRLGTVRLSAKCCPPPRSRPPRSRCRRTWHYRVCRLGTAGHPVHSREEPPVAAIHPGAHAVFIAVNCSCMRRSIALCNGKGIVFCSSSGNLAMDSIMYHGAGLLPLRAAPFKDDSDDCAA